MTADLPDYYDLLRVPRDASAELIQRQWRKLIKEEHPDRFAGVRARAAAANDVQRLHDIDERIELAEQRSRLLNQAYLVLSDPKRRHQYDSGNRQSAAASPRPQGPPRITLSTSRIDLGVISDSVTQPFQVTIKNQGGMPSEISIDWETEPPWAGELTIITDPHNTFPIVVKSQVSAAEMAYSTHAARLLIQVDGAVYPVDVTFRLQPALVSHGGVVPITGARLGGVPGMRPQISLSRPRVDFGFVTRGERLKSQVIIRNSGGMPRQLAIDWHTRPPWANLTITPDPRYTFPVRIDIDIDTEDLAFGSYPLELIVRMDRLQVEIPVSFEMRDPRSAPRPRYASSTPARRPASIRVFLRILVPAFLIWIVAVIYVLGSSIPFAPGSYGLIGIPTQFVVGNNNQTLISATPTTGGPGSFQPTAAIDAGAAKNVTQVPPDYPGPTPTVTSTPIPNPVTIPASWNRFPEEDLKNSSWDDLPVFIAGDDAKLTEVDGIFHWTIASRYTHRWWMLANRPGNLADFFASVRGQKISGAPGTTSYGLVFWNSQPDQYMTFVVNDNGTFTVNQQDVTSEQVIQEGPLAATGNEYLIATLARGSHIKFYVNGLMVYEASGISMPRGKVGLYAEINGAAVTSDISFDNLEIYTP